MKRIAVPFLIITVIVALLHWFIYSMITFSFLQPPVWLTALMVLGVIAMPGTMLLSLSRLREKLRFVILAGHIWMGVFTIAFFFAVIQFLFSLFSLPLHSGWVIVATGIISLWSLRINFTGPKMIDHIVAGPADLLDLKILQISDLHIGMPLLREAWLKKVVEKINKANADFVVITGDLVDAPFEDASRMLEPLKSIKAPKFYVTGNHEYIRGGDWEARLRELGFETLHNSNKIVSYRNSRIMFAGVPDRRVNRFHKSLESNPEVALTTSETVDYKVLLAHEPSSIYDIDKQKCDLLLSGHTHGGQIFPFGLFVRLDQPIVAGFKTMKDICVFVHQGTGYWGPPMRWFTRSEIVTLHFI